MKRERPIRADVTGFVHVRQIWTQNGHLSAAYFGVKGSVKMPLSATVAHDLVGDVYTPHV